MQSLSIIERLDVVKQVGGRFGPGAITGAMHPLILQAIEETFRWRVIPTISLAAHRTHHAVFFQPDLKGMACILAAPVGVMHQPRRRLPAKPRHGQRIQHDVRRHLRFDRPADDFPVEQINDDGQIQPAFIRPNVGHVGGPNLVGRCGREVPVEQILRDRQRVLRVRRRLVAPLVTGANTVLFHQPLDSRFAGRKSAISQFLGDAGRSVGVFQFFVDSADEHQHLPIRQSLAI